MVTILLFCIISVAFTLWGVFRDWYFSWGVCVFYGVLAFMIGAVPGIIIASFIPVKTERVVETKHIQTLQDNSSVSGEFLLGSGRIEGKMKYVFYYESDGGYRMKQVDCSGVLIKSTKSTPKVEIYKKKLTDDFINNFGLFTWFERKNKYIIYVPKGTIKHNYNLDAK